MKVLIVVVALLALLFILSAAGVFNAGTDVFSSCDPQLGSFDLKRLDGECLKPMLSDNKTCQIAEGGVGSQKLWVSVEGGAVNYALTMPDLPKVGGEDDSTLSTTCYQSLPIPSKGGKLALTQCQASGSTRCKLLAKSKVSASERCPQKKVPDL